MKQRRKWCHLKKRNFLYRYTSSGQIDRYVQILDERKNIKNKGIAQTLASKIDWKQVGRENGMSIRY